MNVPLLQEIKARILAEPDAFRMDVWSCGTAHCIAGWALALNGLELAAPESSALNDGRRARDVAAELLGITHLVNTDDYSYDGRSDADRLFYVEGWPATLEARYEDIESDEHCGIKDTTAARRDRAQIAADRIDHFIATNGAE